MTDKRIGLLARLFRRQGGENALVSELYTRAIGRPLFAQPDLGAMMIRGFLDGASALAGETRRDDEHGPGVSTYGSVGILDICGALVARPAGWCSPQAYEEIHDAFDSMMADPAIQSIVMRLDSPGGEAAQVLDLADHIRESRGDKPIIAMVDDMAYSAAYAIASAADQIWVTRSGGVGSVGVVAYHVDQSEFNKKLGVSIEYLYAGERKIDGNPHEPLSNGARSQFQSEIDRLYDLFVETVAANRGLDVEAVRATEAGMYHGERAVDARMADRVGTFRDLLAELSGATSESPTAQPAGNSMSAPAVSSPSASVDDGADPAADQSAGQDDDEQGVEEEIAAQAEVEPSGETAGMETSGDNEADQEEPGMSREEKRASEIRAICAAAGLPDVAPDYIAAGTDPMQVRSDLTEMLSAGETEIQNRKHVASAEAPVADQPNSAAIYASRRRNKRSN